MIIIEMVLCPFEFNSMKIIMNIIVFFYCHFYWLRDALIQKCAHFERLRRSNLFNTHGHTDYRTYLYMTDSEIWQLLIDENKQFQCGKLSLWQKIATRIIYYRHWKRFCPFSEVLLWTSLLFFSEMSWRIDEILSAADFINHKFYHPEENVFFRKIDCPWCKRRRKKICSEVINIDSSVENMNNPFEDDANQLLTFPHFKLKIPRIVTINCQWAENIKCSV